MQIFLVNAIMQMTGNKIDILYCGRSRFLLLEKFFLSCLNYKRSQSPSQRQWVCDENTEDKVLWLVASVGKVVLCESLSSTINIIPSCDNDNYAQETRWSCPGHWSATHTIIHYWTSSTHWMTFVGTPLSILGGDPKTNYGRKGKFIERIFLFSQTASIQNTL